MFIAKIQSKVIEQGVLTVHVQYTDGVITAVESCKPQNEAGLKYWIKSRLETFNAGPVINSTYADGSTVDVSDPLPPPPPTQQEIARAEWLVLYRRWVEVKTKLVDTGVLTGLETKVTQLKTKVQNDFLPAYIDYI